MPDLLIHWLNPSKLIQSHFRQSRLIQRLLGRALGAKEATIAKLPQGSPEDNSWGANQLASRPDKPQALGSRVNWTQGFSTPLLGQCEYLQSLLNTYWESEMESGGINPRRGDQLVPETLTSMVILKLILWVAPARNPAVSALPRQQPGKFYPPLSPSVFICKKMIISTLISPGDGWWRTRWWIKRTWSPPAPKNTSKIYLHVKQFSLKTDLRLVEKLLLKKQNTHIKSTKNTLVKQKNKKHTESGRKA